MLPHTNTGWCSTRAIQSMHTCRLRPGVNTLNRRTHRSTASGMYGTGTHSGLGLRPDTLYSYTELSSCSTFMPMEKAFGSYVRLVQSAQNWWVGQRSEGVEQDF